jgi:membrane fusion protein (multidrug efflux system)
MIKRFLVVILLLGAVFGGVAWLKLQQMQQMAAMQARPQPPAVIAATEVTAETWRPALRAVGSLKAVNGIAVTTEVAGIVSKIRFESGSTVEKGDVLLELDRDVDLAALAALRADARLSEVQFRRAEDLLPKRALSQSEFDEAKARYDAARARVAEQAAVMDLKTVRAPFGGRLGIRRVDLGQYLEPGQAIVSLQALDPIYVDYTLPERHLREVSVGQEVEVRLEALPGEVFTGRILAVEPGVEEGTRSVAVRATLSNPAGRMLPGMFAEVRTLAPESQEVLTVPRTAISFNTYGDFAFVITEGEDGKLTAKRHQVTTGASRAGRVVVEEGLAAGDRVVRAGLVKLRDGQAVSVDNSVALSDAEVSGE